MRLNQSASCSLVSRQAKSLDFKNTILIMTSNIGANYLLEGIRPDGQIDEKAEELVMNDLRSHFRPEFLNRLDETILFKPLTRKNIGGIVELIVADLNRRLADRDLSLELTEEAERFIVDNAYDPVYGARPLKRYIQKAPMLEVMMRIVFLKSTVRPWESVMRPSSRTWSSTLNTSGWAFSISSNSTTL